MHGIDHPHCRRHEPHLRDGRPGGGQRRGRFRLGSGTGGDFDDDNDVDADDYAILSRNIGGYRKACDPLLGGSADPDGPKWELRVELPSGLAFIKRLRPDVGGNATLAIEIWGPQRKVFAGDLGALDFESTPSVFVQGKVVLNPFAFGNDSVALLPPGGGSPVPVTPPWAEVHIATGQLLSLGVIFEPGAITDLNDVTLYYLEESATMKFAAPVLEPSSLWLIAAGAMMLLGLARRRLVA